MNSTYWLIEWLQQAPPYTHLHPEAEWLSRGVHDWTIESVRVEKWTKDARDAIRFPSKEDAEAVIGWLWGRGFSVYAATEHEDVEASPPPQPVNAEAEITDDAVHEMCEYLGHNPDHSACMNCPAWEELEHHGKAQRGCYGLAAETIRKALDAVGCSAQSFSVTGDAEAAAREIWDTFELTRKPKAHPLNPSDDLNDDEKLEAIIRKHQPTKAGKP